MGGVTTAPSTASTRVMRERVVEAAVAVTAEIGWSQVTMGRIAERVGVSRQTVHHEVGTRSGLAEAMIGYELDRFLGVVELAFDEQPDDLVAAIGQASRSVLELAQDNVLLHAVVSATHGADTELLPLLTTHADSLLVTAKAVLVERVASYGVDLPRERLEQVVDMVVRVVLSHVMAPSASPAETSAAVAWIAARLLTP
jgi:AcrR family transcriptional regulator